MIPLKWKLYKALNYIQLAYSFLFFMWLTWLLISIPEPPDRPGQSDAVIIRNLVILLFLLLSVHPLINIVLLAKNFPDKVISGSKTTLFITSLVMNIVTAPGLFIITIAGFIAEMEDGVSRGDNLFKIFLTILALMAFVNLFLLICQFGLRRFLKKNSLSSIRSLIDSIGNTTPANSQD